ncbi:MAG: hypothetical protein IH984_10680 [Planctomycetes bacterium]|nr:hypothetical protein [Planctomycetota bacterium]
MSSIVAESQVKAVNEPFREHAGSVLRQLRTAISGLLTSIPLTKDAKTATELQRALGINSNLSWQIHRLLSASDPLTVGTHIPKKAAMKGFLTAAGKCGATRPLIQKVNEAIGAFEELVSQHAGNRMTFDSMMGALAESDTSALVDLQHRRAAFRAQSHLYGMQAKTHMSCFIAQPSAGDSSLIDMVLIRGMVELRQLRQDAVCVMSRRNVGWDDGAQHQPILSEPLDEREHHKGSDGPNLLIDFCSQPLPALRNVQDSDGYMVSELVNNTIGKQGAITSIVGEVMREADSRYRENNNDLLAVNAFIRKPFEVAVMDLLVREGTYGDELPIPRVKVVNDVEGRPWLPVETQAEFAFPDLKVAYLGKGAHVMSSPDVPRYPEMTQYAFDRLGWDGEKFDVFRCRITYPVMPSMLALQVDLPEKP